MVSQVKDEKTIVKGLEVTGRTVDLSNLAARRGVFENARFDHSFRGVEDIELLYRLKQTGYHIKQIDRAPVIHLSKHESRHYVRGAFHYGLSAARMQFRNDEPVQIGDLLYAKELLIAGLLKLSGLIVGWVIYWTERFDRYAGSRE